MAFITKFHKALSTTGSYSLFRRFSNIPENTIYGGPKLQNSDKRITLTQIKQKYKKHEPITVVTAYDYPSAVHVDTAGIDVCLVGDSAAMVVHGHDTTLPISLHEMLVHCRSVARGARRPLLVCDLPFGTYETSINQEDEDGWPLGLQPLNHNADLSGFATASPTSTTVSSSDLDTESTGSFFHEKSKTLGGLLGASNMNDQSRKKSKNARKGESFKERKKCNSRTWVFSLVF